MRYFNKKVTSVVISVILTASFFTGCNKTNKQDSQAVFNNIKSETKIENMTNTIKELTSEKYEGRLTGSLENKMAGDFIAEHFKKIGLQSPKDINDFMQYYKQNTIRMKNRPLMKTFDSSNNILKEYQFLDNFYFTPASRRKINGVAAAQMYYVSKEGDLNKDNKQLENRVLLIPKEIYSNKNISDFDNILNLVPSIKALVIERDKNDPKQFEAGYFMNPVNVPSPTSINNDGAFMVMCDSPTFSELKASAEKEQSLYLEASYEIEAKEVANIVGMISGSDDKLKDEYIMISCHYDHIGNNMNGTYNPGAFDNASGTSVMMEVARILKTKDIKPKKSIMFVAFNGEENGLIGSNKFAFNPPCDLSKTVDINLDMLAGKNNLPLTFYSTKDSDLIKDLSVYADKLKINHDKKTGNRSDHTSIEDMGGQAVTLIEWDMKSGYHSPKDTMDIIDTKELGRIADFVCYYITNKAL